MPNVNLEDKIQEALNKKGYKKFKAEYIGLTFIYCVLLFLTYVLYTFIPFAGLLIFFFIVIPLIMGYKHFIWFGPASGETLMDGFKVSLICSYLNFVSYIKIFFKTNLVPLLIALLFGSGVNYIGMLYCLNKANINLNEMMVNLNVESLLESVESNQVLMNQLNVVFYISLVVMLFVFFIARIKRGLLTYSSFLKLTNTGLLVNNNKLISVNPKKYYLTTFLFHLLYIIPIGLYFATSFGLSQIDVLSPNTIELLSMLVLFMVLIPVTLSIELHYRNFCISANQVVVAEQKKMLDVAINDANKK